MSPPRSSRQSPRGGPKRADRARRGAPWSKKRSGNVTADRKPQGGSTAPPGRQPQGRYPAPPGRKPQRDRPAPRAARKPKFRPRPARRPGPAVVEAGDGLAPRWPDVTSLLRRQPWNDLTPHLINAGASVDAVMPPLRRYCEMVVQWNRKVSNIISRNDEPRIVARHVLESLAPAHWLKASGATRWLDFGSGAGFPALPLAIAGVGGEWTLVESRRTKTLFLRKAVEEIGIRGVKVLHARLEELVGTEEHAGSYDGFTSRATETLAPTLSIAAKFVRPGGAAFLWKGSRRDAEMAADAMWQTNWDFEGLLEIGGGATAVARFCRK